MLYRAATWMGRSGCRTTGVTCGWHWRLCRATMFQKSGTWLSLKATEISWVKEFLMATCDNRGNYITMVYWSWEPFQISSGSVIPVLWIWATWFWSRGPGHLVLVIWFRSSSSGHLVQVIWFRSSGSGHLVPVMWFRSSGSGHLVPVIWFRSSGSGHLVLVTWFLPRGSFHLVLVTWSDKMKKRDAAHGSVSYRYK